MNYKVVGYWDYETNTIIEKFPNKPGWFQVIIRPEIYELGCWTEGMTVQHKHSREIFTVVGTDDQKEGYIICQHTNGLNTSFDYRDLECFDCNILGHNWENHALFTGSYKKCKRCGKEE